MIYANDEIFNIGYNSEVDRLQIKKNKKESNLKRIINENKVMSVLILLFFMFCSLNCIIIYTFIDLLKNL